MPISQDQAVEIARRYGLSLTDAASLQAMARDESEAESIAARFAPTLPEQITNAEQAGDWQTAGALKSRWLDEIRSRTDHNGYQPTSQPDQPAEQPPADQQPATPVEALRSGSPHGEPSLQEQIAAAEAAGDWQTAGALKSQQIQQLRQQMEGHRR